MFSRFRIEDLISQDSESVVYLGVDEASGEWAALRRFFFRDSGTAGIMKENQAEFVEAIELLTQVDHPNLRRVLEGGLDEIDGVPYVATEGVEGEFLRDVMAAGDLSSDDGAVLIQQGLSVAEYLESFFGEGAHWLKVHPDSIIVLDSEKGRSFTFSVSLDRWMGIEEGNQGVLELASLVEKACGLRRETKLEGGGFLGEWIRHVRDSQPSLSEARGALNFIKSQKANAPAVAVPMLAKQESAEAPRGTVLAPTHKPLTSAEPKSKKRGLVITLVSVAVAVVIGGGVFAAMKARPDGASNQVAEEKGEQVSEESVEQEEVEEEETEPITPVASVQNARPDNFEELKARAQKMRDDLKELQNRTEFEAGEGELISTRNGDEITVIGEVHDVRQTKSWFVFEFFKKRGPDVFCVVLPKKGVGETTLQDLKKYNGERLRFHGTVSHYRAGQYQRVYLRIGSLDDFSEEL